MRTCLDFDALSYTYDYCWHQQHGPKKTATLKVIDWFLGMCVCVFEAENAASHFPSHTAMFTDMTLVSNGASAH